MKLTSDSGIFKSVHKIYKWQVDNATRQEVLTWIDALKSGSYKQGKGTLKRNNMYCCLGVLSCLQGAEWKKDEEDQETYPYYNDVREDFCYLPKAIADKFNMSDKGLHIEVLDDRDVIRTVHLALLNDNGVPFNEIADIIGLALRGGYDAPPPPKQVEVTKSKK